MSRLKPSKGFASALKYLIIPEASLELHRRVNRLDQTARATTVHHLLGFASLQFLPNEYRGGML